MAVWRLRRLRRLGGYGGGYFASGDFGHGFGVGHFGGLAAAPAASAAAHGRLRRWPHGRLWRRAYGRRRPLPLNEGSAGVSGGLRAALFFCPRLRLKAIPSKTGCIRPVSSVSGNRWSARVFLEAGRALVAQTDQMKEVMMTYSVPRTSASVPRTSALAFGVAALVSLSALSAARADSLSEPAPTPSVTMPAHPVSTTTPAPTSSASAPSLSEPSPTPAWAESGPHGKVARNSPVRHSAHHHYAYRNEQAAAATILSRRSLWV